MRGHVMHLARRQLRVPWGGGSQRAGTRVPRLSGAVRLAAAATVTLAVVGGVAWIGHAADPGVPAETAMTRVGAGETVWDVAHRVAPKSDQRAVVERIRQLNGMASSAVAPGQQLQVPDHH
ncbi:MAG: LysM peptidoglycan-binding domain-containing protein [Actinomycetota bacterium]|nr:LysM peptidoglycan-binding domain-containing protein [Actinomycetota bacterium]